MDSSSDLTTKNGRIKDWTMDFSNYTGNLTSKHDWLVVSIPLKNMN